MSSLGFRFPARIYPIVDPLGGPPHRAVELAAALLAAGAPLIQLRMKDRPTQEVLEVALELRRRADAHAARLLINDRADIALAAGAAGVHLGQQDLSPADARRILGPQAIIGWSTHDAEQVRAAERMSGIDYIGFGPIFATRNKERPDPVQGVEGLRCVRPLTRLPIAAIGGIVADAVPGILDAGADSVAMIGAICAAADPGAVFARLRAAAERSRT